METITSQLSYEDRKKFGQTLLGFGLIYFPHHVYLKPAKYHPELVSSLDNPEIDMLEIIGHRGSTKSTWGSLIYPIYMALVHPDVYPFIVPVADTGLQASMNMANIKTELEENSLLKQDFGNVTIGKKIHDKAPEPTLESDEEWQSKNLLLSTGVRILARSRGQKIRGLKHRQYRPGLVIVDDPEDLEWVRTKENRDKTTRWFLGEVLPAMDLRRRKCVLIGNWLHMDALMARMKNKGIFKVLEFPLIDKNGICQWPALYPTQEFIDMKKKEFGPVAWQREMLLKAVPEDGQIITEEDIHYYDIESPQAIMGIKATGVDPAISKKQSADFTAMVSGKAAWVNNEPKIYVQPNPINSRMGVEEQVSQAKAIDARWPGEHMLFVEAVAYQLALVELMEKAMLPVQTIKPTTDKRARLMVASTYIKNGTVEFPRTGCEDLIIQLLGFGVEEHDDLVDALVMMINGIIEAGIEMPKIVLLG
jgi:predicted phage terminase large subunit-like protein